MQFIVISEQLQAVLWALILGAFFAAAYDVLRVVRMLLCSQGIKKLKIAEKIPTVTLAGGAVGDHLQMLFANITDVLYSVFAAVSFCIFLYYMNNGRFRWYLLLACVVGFILYRLSIGIAVKAAFGYITGVIRTVCGFVLYLITRPAVFLSRGVVRLASPVAENIQRRIKIRKTEKIGKSLRDAVRF